VVYCYVYLCLTKPSFFVTHIAEIEWTVDRDEWKRLLISVMNCSCWTSGELLVTERLSAWQQGSYCVEFENYTRSAAIIGIDGSTKSSLEQSPSWEANISSDTQEIATFYGTRGFITAFTSARHLSLSWARSIQSIPPHPSSLISPACAVPKDQSKYEALWNAA